MNGTLLTKAQAARLPDDAPGGWSGASCAAARCPGPGGGGWDAT